MPVKRKPKTPVAIQRPVDIHTLLSKAQSTSDWQGAIQAIQMLGDVQCIDATETFMHLLSTLTSTDNQIMLEAIEALGKIGDQKAVPALIHALYATELQEQFETHVHERKKQDNRDMYEHVADALYADEIRQIRASAALALGQMECTEAIPHFQALLYKENIAIPDDQIRQALARIGTPEAIQVLADWSQRQREWIDAIRGK